MDIMDRFLKWLRSIPSPPKLAPTLNKVIDGLFHPHFEEHKGFVLADSIAHAVVEQADSFVASVAKTIKYNLDKLVGEEKEK